MVGKKDEGVNEYSETVRPQFGTSVGATVSGTVSGTPHLEDFLRKKFSANIENDSSYVTICGSSTLSSRKTKSFDSLKL